MSAVFWDNNTHRLTLHELRNLDGDIVADAEVTAALRDDRGNEVAGATWPLDMDPDQTTPGTYACLIPSDIDVSSGDVVYFYINALKTPLVGEWVLKTRVKLRSV